MALDIIRRAFRRKRGVDDSSDSSDCYMRGLAEFQRGSYAAALTQFRQGLMLQGGNADIHCAIGQCYNALGDHTAMLRAYDAALAANYNHLSTHEALAHWSLPGP